MTAKDIKKLNIVTNNDLNLALINYPTKADLRVILENYPTKEDLKIALGNYPTKEDLKIALENYATKEDLRLAIKELRDEMRNGFKELHRKFDILLEQMAKITVKTTIYDDTLSNHYVRLNDLDMRVIKIEKKS